MSTDASTIIKDWPDDARTVTAALIAKYGAADEVTPTQVTWHNRAAWKGVVTAA